MRETLEVCIDSPSALDECVRGGADRIELCSSLALGGLTPSTGMMKLAAQIDIPVYVMIRPRAGNFIFSDADIKAMCHDIEAAGDCGLAGVVLGAASAKRTLDLTVLRQLCRAAGSLGKTLHRVIDIVDYPLIALEQAIDLGFDYILTSGGKQKVADGLPTLAKLNDQAANRITIVAGAGLTPELIPDIYRLTGIGSFHSSCSKPMVIDEKTKAMGFATEHLFVTCAERIEQYKQAVVNLNC